MPLSSGSSGGPVDLDWCRESHIAMQKTYIPADERRDSAYHALPEGACEGDGGVTRLAPTEDLAARELRADPRASDGRRGHSARYRLGAKLAAMRREASVPSVRWWRA